MNNSYYNNYIKEEKQNSIWIKFIDSNEKYLKKNFGFDYQLIFLNILLLIPVKISYKVKYKNT